MTSTKAVSIRAAAVLAAVAVSLTGITAQTVIKLPKNRFTPEQDVKIGLEGAAEVRQQYPIIKDEKIAHYLTTLGDRLVANARPCSDVPIVERLPLQSRRELCGHRQCYSITSSARASRLGGTARLSPLAVFRLRVNSNLVGCRNGKSAGLAPRRMRPT